MENIVRRATTRRGKRILEEKAPKVHENDKKVLIMKGSKTNVLIQGVLKELYDVLKPNSVKLKRRQNIHPFESSHDTDYFSSRNDTSLWLLGTSSKKRPFRLVMGRQFGYPSSSPLDMLEFTVKNYVPSSHFLREGTKRLNLGVKPLVVAQGAQFSTSEGMKTALNMLVDMFKGPELEKMNIYGVQRAVVLSACEKNEHFACDCSEFKDEVPQDSNLGPRIRFQQFSVSLKHQQNTSLPKVELDEVGPRLDLFLDRYKLADKDMWKEAMKVPSEIKPKKKKNIAKTGLGETIGKIHFEKPIENRLHTPMWHKKVHEAIETGTPKRTGPTPPKKRKKMSQSQT